MRYIFFGLILCLLLSTIAPARALETPRLIPRSQQIARPMDEVYASLKKYFADPALSRFKLVSADPATHTLVATMSGIDNESWSKWSFCKTGPVEMIYKFEDGTVTLTVRVEKTTRHSSFATVTADFQGSYQLGANENKIACSSKGELEDNILAVAGSQTNK